jgi:hypothetical protein
MICSGTMDVLPIMKQLHSRGRMYIPATVKILVDTITMALSVNLQEEYAEKSGGSNQRNVDRRLDLLVVNT